MPITKRTLEKWRREALLMNTSAQTISEDYAGVIAKQTLQVSERILRLTQELLDQRLMEGRKS